MNYLYEGYLTVAGRYLLIAACTFTAIVLASCGAGFLIGVLLNG